MVPKIIHYCWFGGNEKSPLAKQCIKSWKKYLPEYELIEWNEQNFDITLYRFALEAYQEKKYAFTADVCRLHALLEMGGVYLDTDVEILKPFPEALLNNRAFLGREFGRKTATAVIGSEAGGALVRDILDIYRNRSFYRSNQAVDTTTIVEIITDYLVKEKALLLTDCEQDIPGYCKIYPREYFDPKDIDTRKLPFLTDNTVSIHHYDGSWTTHNTGKSVILKRILGDKITNMLRFYYGKIKKEY